MGLFSRKTWKFDKNMGKFEKTKEKGANYIEFKVFEKIIEKKGLEVGDIVENYEISPEFINALNISLQYQKAILGITLYPLPAQIVGVVQAFHESHHYLGLVFNGVYSAQFLNTFDETLKNVQGIIDNFYAGLDAQFSIYEYTHPPRIVFTGVSF
ncbi:hypothetical protein KQY27_00240 [Methanobrevibacter sp. TMH8]|uniref:hypothetical protein n=1 Tax=Methanobrevibacter sp. TMH8 TaxID=2848611 RepID=UPI001CD01FC3|nr:hypothetical protein [Methanobrevibacter sp. TMH8]MBZ9569987.1 hypothetical protein [Methanobrevibacter sp. TMH8]